MKLYIENYKPDKLTPKKIKALEKYLTNCINTINIYSEEGIYTVDNKSIHKINYIDETSLKLPNYIDDYNFILDNSIVKQTETVQIPFKHIKQINTCYIYELNNKSSIKLHINELTTEQNTKIIYDLYFVISNKIDITNIFCKEEINVFLSLLN